MFVWLALSVGVASTRTSGDAAAARDWPWTDGRARDLGKGPQIIYILYSHFHVEQVSHTGIPGSENFFCLLIFCVVGVG